MNDVIEELLEIGSEIETAVEGIAVDDDDLKEVVALLKTTRDRLGKLALSMAGEVVG